MPDDSISAVTLADFTGPTTDEGGGRYELYVGADAPLFDPFADYPDGVAEPFDLSMFAVPAALSASLAHNLDVRRHNIWHCWGTGVQVGWIGDASHQAECSDHNPDIHGVVHAIDPMVTGVRAAAVVKEALAHPDDLQYVIHNRVIWSVSVGWQARRYTGSDPHTNHVHISGKHGSSNGNGATCTGYNLAAQNSAPTFNVCGPTPPPPPPPPSGHTPGSRALQLQSPHMSGADVAFVQRFIGPKQAGPADGDFGPGTKSGVEWYQRLRTIAVDGVVGPKTWSQMGVRWQG